MKIDNQYLLNHKNNNFKKDLNLTRKYYKFLFNFLHKRLNKKLGINYSKRQWNILIGRWLRFYVDATYFRYNYLIKSIKGNKIENFYFKFNNKNNYIPNTTSDFNAITDSQERNNFYSWQILNYIRKDYPIEKIKIFKTSSNQKINLDFYYQRFYNFRTIRYNIIVLVNFFLKLFLKKNSSIIVSSYLSFIKESILKIKNKSFFFWNHFFMKKNYDLSRILKDKSIKKKERNNIFEVKKYKGFEGLLLSLLDSYFPTCFLENFHHMDSFVKKNLIVKNPRFIFTSNEFLYNEFFKHYTALAVAGRSKYIVGQHGSAYGSLSDQLNTVEELTSDYFLTWGWKQNKNHQPLGLFTQLGKKKLYINRKINNLLLVNTNFPHKREFWDINEYYLNNLDEQIKFLKTLDFSLFAKVIVRSHHADKKILHTLKSIYRKINNKIIIDNGVKKIEDYTNNNTLIVFSYLSTGFYEFFSRNIKCISFDSLKKERYQPKFYKELNKLNKDKLFFHNGSIASKHINSMLKENNLEIPNYNFNRSNCGFIKNYADCDKVNINKINQILNK